MYFMGSTPYKTYVYLFMKRMQKTLHFSADCLKSIFSFISHISMFCYCSINIK